MSMTKTRTLRPTEWWNWKKETRAQAVPTRAAMKRTRISAGIGWLLWSYWWTNQARMPQTGARVRSWRARMIGKRTLLTAIVRGYSLLCRV